jgi:hypothetical protein
VGIFPLNIFASVVLAVISAKLFIQYIFIPQAIASCGDGNIKYELSAIK